MTLDEYYSGKVTHDQRVAFEKLQEASGIPFNILLDRATCPTPTCPYVGVHDFHGMFVGIERDGYTHT